MCLVSIVGIYRQAVQSHLAVSLSVLISSNHPKISNVFALFLNRTEFDRIKFPTSQLLAAFPPLPPQTLGTVSVASKYIKATFHQLADNYLNEAVFK